ncbi:MAG TPA: glycosyltransferase family 87 protein [Myxococcales bacterium]
MLVASSLGIATGIFAFAGAAGLMGSWPAALAIGVLAVALATRAFWKHPVVELDESACSPGLKIVSGLATLVAIVEIARLSVFMIAPAQVGWSAVPSSDWEVRHSCLSAYFIAAQAAGEAPNIYEGSLYTAPDDNPAAPRKPRMLGPFRIDVYEYPPPFLTLPRALRVLVPDFIRFRALWFGLNAGVVLLAMVVAARSLGRVAGTRALLLSPLVWASLPTLSTLQKGNVQALVIAVSMLAMHLFERRRRASGGALLAFATVSKLFPGMLAVYLLARRQWRALAWTAGLGGALVLLTLLDLGWPPFADFLGHLPGLVGGEAFPAFRNPSATAVNYSLPGIVFKLKLFGLAGMSFGVAKTIGWIYTVAAIWATVFLALRPLRDGEKPLAWIAILILATLRSPFLPQAYAAFPPLWLLTLLAATYAPSTKVMFLTLLGWLSLNVFWPLDWGMAPRLLAVLTTLPQAVTIVLAVLVLRRAAASRPRASRTFASEGATIPAIS